MTTAAAFRLRVEGIFDLTGRGTAIVGAVLQGVVSVGDRLRIEDQEHGLIAECVAIDFAPQAPRTKTDGLQRVGLIVPSWSKADVVEGDVLVTVI